MDILSNLLKTIRRYFGISIWIKNFAFIYINWQDYEHGFYQANKGYPVTFIIKF